METPSCCAFLDALLHLWLSLPSLRTSSPPNPPSQFLEALGDQLPCWSSVRDPASPSAGGAGVSAGQKPRSHMQQCGYKKKESFSRVSLGPLLSLSHFFSLKHLLEATAVKTAASSGMACTRTLQCRSPGVSRVCVSLSVHRDLPHVPAASAACLCEELWRQESAPALPPPLDLTPASYFTKLEGLGYY